MEQLTIPNNLLDFIKSLSSESRLQIILAFIDGGERTVNEIAELVGLGQSTTSEHLAILKRAGVLTSRKENRQVFYKPNREKIITMLEMLTGMMKSCC